MRADRDRHAPRWGYRSLEASDQSTGDCAFQPRSFCGRPSILTLGSRPGPPFDGEAHVEFTHELAIGFLGRSNSSARRNRQRRPAATSQPQGYPWLPRPNFATSPSVAPAPRRFSASPRTSDSPRLSNRRTRLHRDRDVRTDRRRRPSSANRSPTHALRVCACRA
jgi:hypothetical protein